MKVLNLFPLSIIQDKILIDTDIKKQMLEEIQTMQIASKNKNYKLPQDSWTGDTQGFEYLFKNQKFELLFKQIKTKLVNYLRHLGINENKVDLYMTRSWATISNGKERIRQHKHQQSHISFAYYLKKDIENSNLFFFNENSINEIVPSLFTSPTLKKAGVIKEMNLFNAPSVDIKVEEDDIVIFPSKAMHGTQFNKSNNERISISGDVICLAKESELLENMMPPLEKWDKM
tara:strand:+ start:97 stop:789 length:693 start_codon:yes stop_codon:yes gene_type:complete